MPYVSADGADLYVEGRTEGTPIVFLHGVMAGLRFFRPQLSGLSEPYRPIALDFRGHGRSSKTETGHTVAQYARDVHSVLRQLDLDDVVLVGWSMGASVAWEYVDQFGTDRLRGLVVVDMTAAAFQWEDYEHGSTDLSRLTSVLELAQTDHSSLIESILERIFKDPVSSETRTMAFDEATRVPPPIKSAIVFDYTMRDYREVLPGIDVPTLVCAGADEKWRSVAAVEYVAELLPDAEFEVFEDSGHCPFLEEADRFTRVLEEFVDSTA
ncbi:alpha/beta fold hydrolase [Natronococcus wangiae]|uniref:alpha/beta fold hydrolase n=1 Tax=Natronococcus wangiae TaxID=3068275 RepID=UPI00273ED942|nr:alpha/beta hydrolase [Natronococcus sp. AD5]